jgi:hypothetical protein
MAGTMAMTKKTKAHWSIDEQQHRSPHERSEMRDQIRNPDIASLFRATLANANPPYVALPQSSSCPGLSRASTSWLNSDKKDVDGRDEARP